MRASVCITLSFFLFSSLSFPLSFCLSLPFYFKSKYFLFPQFGSSQRMILKKGRGEKNLMGTGEPFPCLPFSPLLSSSLSPSFSNFFLTLVTFSSCYIIYCFLLLDTLFGSCSERASLSPSPYKLKQREREKTGLRSGNELPVPSSSVPVGSRYQPCYSFLFSLSLSLSLSFGLLTFPFLPASQQVLLCYQPRKLKWVAKKGRMKSGRELNE